MRKVLKWALRLILGVVVLSAAIGLWKREEISRLLAVNSLFDAEVIVGNFSNMERAFLTVAVPRGEGAVSELPVGDERPLPEAVGPWIEARAVTSLLVLKGGQIVHESYYQRTGAEDRRISWSVAKSYLSALLGAVMAEGKIASLDDQVTQYAPQLKGSAYDGVTLRHVLNMSSGVKFNEDYLDFHSDINRMGRVLALGKSMDGFTAELVERAQAPGAAWQYVSTDTHVIGMVIRGATGRDIPSLLSEKIIAPLGLEAEPYYLTDGYGVGFVMGGLNLTTRDYARFGLMVAQGGVYAGQQVVPADWLAAATIASAPTAPGATRYGYQWWIPAGAPDGVFFARGIYGQYIYIDQTRDVVIVSTAADRAFRNEGVAEQNLAILAQIAASL